MKPLGLLMAAASLGLGACAKLPPWPAEPPAHTVTLGGEDFFLRQITESTWIANSAENKKILAGTPAATALLRKAVEAVSGCTVTDSDYSRQKMQFDAQVSCAGSLQN